MDTVTEVGKEIMLKDKGYPKEQAGVQMGPSQDSIGVLPAAWNYPGEVPYRDTLPVQPFLHDHARMYHKQRAAN